jgi:structure-specific recognition protein 1
LTQVSQCVLPGTNRNELELQFPESDTIEAGTDQLVAIRMYIPPDPEADPADKDADTAAELLQQSILQKAQIRKTTGADVMVTFPACAFLTPRGRYDLELFDSFLRMRGPKYDYKIRYDDISRYFLLPKPDEVHMAFVICLDKPIRQGQQRYQYLVMQAVKEQDEVTVNLDEETMKSEYGGDLQPVMRGSYTNLLGKIFKVVTRKKVLIPGKFTNAGQQACLHCSVRANEGLLYPLEKQFVFIHKPPIIVKFKEISSVEFQRYAGGSTRGTFRFLSCCAVVAITKILRLKNARL